MEQPDHFLGALPDDDELLEVVGHGRLRRPSGGETEVQVAVHWATPRADGRFGEGCAIVSRWIGCGKLALVPIGSRWRRRMPAPSPWSPVHTATAVCVGIETIGRAVSGRGLDHYPFDVEPEARCFRLELDGNPRKIALLPVVEVIRSVFGCRSGFLRQLFDGVRDPALMKRRFLFDRARSRHVERVVDLFCHSRPTEREAWIAATMMACSVFRASHDGVFARIQVAGGLASGTGSVFETSFPFAGDAPIGLAYEGRIVEIERGSQTVVPLKGVPVPLKRDTTARELITRVRAFESASAFDVVSYSWPRPQTVKGLPPREGGSVSGDRRAIVLVDGITPGTLRATKRLGVEGADALARTGVVFVSRPRLVGDKGSSSASGGRAGAGGRIVGSTADPNPQGDDDVTPMEIEARNADGNPGAGLGRRAKSMIATDDAMRSLNGAGGWSIRGLAAAPGLVPALLPLTNGRSSLAIVEYEITIGAGAVMVYEAGSTDRDKRALGFVARDRMAPFSDDDLGRLRSLVLAARAHWLGGRSFPGHVVSGLRRSGPLWTDVSAYAAAIRTKITAVIKVASER